MPKAASNSCSSLGFFKEFDRLLEPACVLQLAPGALSDIPAAVKDAHNVGLLIAHNLVGLRRLGDDVHVVHGAAHLVRSGHVRRPARQRGQPDIQRGPFGGAAASDENSARALAVLADGERTAGVTRNVVADNNST